MAFDIEMAFREELHSTLIKDWNVFEFRLIFKLFNKIPIRSQIK